MIFFNYEIITRFQEFLNVYALQLFAYKQKTPIGKYVRKCERVARQLYHKTCHPVQQYQRTVCCWFMRDPYARVQFALNIGYTQNLVNMLPTQKLIASSD